MNRPLSLGGAMPESIPAPLIIDTLKDTFRKARAALAAEVAEPPLHGHLGWILSVPDTHQKTVLAALDKEESIRVVTCATEDEATAIAAGLHVGGEPVVLMIQHAGLYASVNTLRGVAIDGRVPVFYMIGLLSRERDKDPRDCRHSMVRYCEPLLDTFGVPHARLEGPNGSLLMQLGSLATVAGAAPRNLVHFLFKNGVYHTSGAQGIPGGLSVDFVMMARGAGYRMVTAIEHLADFKRRLPQLVRAEGPVFVELHTGLAAETPMTVRERTPFHQQLHDARVKLLRPRASATPDP
jgi:sulfopyruvate decarboxylase TPP-binding subunit